MIPPPAHHMGEEVLVQAVTAGSGAVAFALLALRARLEGWARRRRRRP